MAVILAALLTGQYFLYKNLALKNVSYKLTFSKTEVFEGDEFEAVEEIENAKWLPLPWVRTEINTSRRLHFIGDKSEQRGLVSGIIVLRGWQKCRRVWRVSCEKRGLFSINDVSLSASDLFGLCRPTMLVKPSQSIRVLPVPAEVEGGELSKEAFIGSIQVKRFILPDPFVISGAKEYTGREPMNRIHWAQTARVGKPMVYSSEFTTERSVLIVVNMQRSEQNYEGRRLSVTNIEAQIKGAAYMLDECQKTNTACALFANTAPPTATICTQGYEHIMELLRKLAELKNNCGEHINVFLRSIDLNEFTDIVLVTSFVSEQIRDYLHMAQLLGKACLILTTGEENEELCETRHIPRKIYPNDAGDDE